MPSYLTSRASRKGGRRFYFKLRVPPECQSEFGGRAVIVEALKTSDRDSAEIEAHALAKSYLDKIKAHRLDLTRQRALALNLTASEREVLEEAGGLSGLMKALAQSRTEVAITQAAASILADLSARHEAAPDAVAAVPQGALQMRRDAVEAEAEATAALDLLQVVESVSRK
ncbi:MAG TPA: DUF6538 domain-containing protein [Roseomonas sp.]|jgi:hypothetical protein